MELIEKLNSTSDHTCQTIEVELQNVNNESVCKIRGSTWNLLNQGNGANNPFKHTESHKEYMKRKALQLLVLQEKILNGDDFIFLQEIYYFKDFKDSTNHNETYYNQYNSFKQFLKNKGYEIRITPLINLGDIKQVPLAIIYNANKLEFISTKSRPVFYQEQHKEDGQILQYYRGYQFAFEYKENKTAIALTNVHLFFRQLDKDRKKDEEQILTYQQAQIKNNIFTIIGGDTNAPRSILAIGNPEIITNFGIDDGVNITNEHWNTGLNKSYDSFFVNPTSNTKAIIVETEQCEYYYNQDPQSTEKAEYVIRTLSQPGQYETEIGKPYFDTKRGTINNVS